MANVSLSKKEQAIINQIAAERGITPEQAANELASEGLALRVKKQTGRTPSNNVRTFRRGRR